MQCQNKLLDGSSWLLEEILNCTALSGKHNRHHRVQLLTFPGDTRVYIWDGFHYIRAMFLSANVNAVDLRHNLLENWPPGTVLHLVSYYYDFNTEQPENEELAFSLVIEHFFDDGNSSLGLDTLPPTEKLNDVCAFAGKLEVTESMMERKTEAVEAVVTPAPSISRCDQERGENNNSSSNMVLQADPPDGTERGSGIQTKDSHSGPHTRVSLFKPIEMEDLVVTSSQLNLMSFSSFNDEIQNDVPSRCESVSELFEELGRESSNEDQPQREDRDKLKIMHIFKSGDGKSKQIFHAPLTSVDHLIVSSQEEWQLSLIPEWMPGCHPESTSPSSSNRENAGSHSYHEPLFLQPTLDSGNPLSHVSAVTVQKRRDRGDMVSSGEKLDVVADISNEDDAAFSSQNSSHDQPLTRKVKGASSSPPTLVIQGRGNEDTSQPSGEGKIAALSGDSDSLFSDTEAEEVHPAMMQNDGKSDQKLQRQLSKSGACVEKIKKIILSNKTVGSARRDGNRPLDLPCEQGSKGAPVDSSNLYKILKRIISSSETSTSRLQSSPHAADSPQNTLNSPEKRRAAGECLNTIEQSPFQDSSMERRFQMVDDCLLDALQDLVEPVKSCKDDRHVPQSNDSRMSKLTGDTVVVDSSENKKSTVVQNADTDKIIHPLTKANLESPQTLRRASKTKKRLYTAEQNYIDVSRSEVEQMEQSSRNHAKAQHPLNMLLTNLSTKRQSSDLCVTVTENPLQLQSGHKGTSEIQRRITQMQSERTAESRAEAGRCSERPEIVNVPKLTLTEASKSNEEQLIAEPPHKKLQTILRKAFSSQCPSKIHKTAAAETSSPFPQRRCNVREANAELRSNKRQLTRITRWFRPEQNEEGETFSEIPVQSKESVVGDTATTKCKRKRLIVAIENVPSDCTQVLDIKRGMLVSDGVLNNIELMRLFHDGQTSIKVNVKEEIIDSSDDISKTSSPASEKEGRSHMSESRSKSQKHCSAYSGSLNFDKRKRVPDEVFSADEQGASELQSKKKSCGLSVHDLPECVVKVRMIPLKPTEVFNEQLTTPSASGRSSPGREFAASLVGESQGFLPQIEASERLGSDEGW